MTGFSVRSAVRLVNAALLVSLAVMAGYFTVRTLGSNSAARHERMVPALGGVTAESALARLDAEGLLVRAVDATDHAVTAGHVAWQQPVAGTRVPERSVVRLGISRGPPLVAAPDVIGLTAVEARRVIAANGLRVGSSDTVRDTLDVGRVVAQRPVPGSTTHRGTVSLTLSAGVASIPVPHVSGMTLRDARRRLAEAGLVTGEVRTTSDGPPGIVRAQRPEAGVLVTRQSAVELTISEARP